MRYLFISIMVIIAAATAGVVGTMVFKDYAGTPANCNHVRSQGTALRMDAQGSADLGEQARLNREMLTLVDANRSCFTQDELANVETARNLMGGTSGGTDGK